MCCCSIGTYLLLACVTIQVQAVPHSDLVRLAKEAKQLDVQLDVSRGVHLRQKLVKSIQALKWTIYMEPQTGANWNVAAILKEIESEAKSKSPDFDKLNQLAKRFYGSRKCLNQSRYLDVRNDLRSFSYWVRTAHLNDPQNRKKYYQSHLDKLIHELESDPENPDLAEMAAPFNWLAHSGHAPELVEKFRERFSYPAIVIDVNPNMGPQGIKQFNQPVQHTQYTSNLIAGAQVEGESTLTGKFRAELLDDIEHATVRIYMQDGLIKTQDSVGRSEIPVLDGTVLVHGTATTQINKAYVDLHFDGKRIVCGEPVVECSTRSNIKRISVQRNYLLPQLQSARRSLGLGPDLIDKVIQSQASKIAQKKKAQAERESAEIAEKDLARSVKLEITKQLAEIASQVENEITDVLEPNFLRHGVYFERIATQSSSQRLRVAFEKMGIGGLGSPRPIVGHNKTMDSSLELMIHESSSLSFFTELSSGARWDDTTWAYLQRTLTGLNSFSFLIGSRERWSCDMDWDAPVSFRFENDQLTFNFRIRNFQISGVDYPFPFRVSASYRPSIEHYGIDLLRVGDVQIHWLQDVPNDKKFKSFVKETFEDFLQDKQHWDSLIIPYGGAWGDMDKLRFGSFEMRNGWFALRVSPNEFEDSSLFVKDTK